MKCISWYPDHQKIEHPFLEITTYAIPAVLNNITHTSNNTTHVCLVYKKRYVIRQTECFRQSIYPKYDMTW